MAVKDTLSEQSIAHVARLANLPLTIPEVPKYQEQLSGIINLVKKVDEASGSATEEKGTNADEVLRKDEPNSGTILSVDEAVKNGKRDENDLFVVPAVLEEV